MATEGRVVSVKEHQAGSELAEDVIAGATTLVPVDIEEFNLDGGQFTIGTEQEPITYTVDENSDELTLATALANAYSEDEPVYLYPPTVERWCNFVEPDGENTLEARVPHALTPLLPLGIRNPDDATAEIVQADYVGTDLVLTDVLGKEPLIHGRVRSPGFVTENFEDAVLSLEPALYWRLGKNGLKDLSGNKRDGTAQASLPVGEADGLLFQDDDAATEFNGSTQYATSTYNPFSDTAIRCYGGLAKPDDFTTGNVLFGGFGAGGKHPILLLEQNASTSKTYVDFFIRSDDATSTSRAIWFAWPNVSQVVFWFLRVDPVNDMAELFIDGRSKGVVTGLTQTYFTGGTNNVALGTHGNTGPNEPFDGILDEFFVIEDDVSDAQIAALYRIATGEDLEPIKRGTVGYEVPENETTHVGEGQYAVIQDTLTVDGTLEFEGRTLEVPGAWQAWTPTWTNLTVGDGTTSAVFALIGDTVIFNVKFVFGSTSSISASVSVSLPVASGSSNSNHLGFARFRDDSTSTDYTGEMRRSSGTVTVIRVLKVDGTYANLANLSSTVPFTWTTGDEIHLTGVYEA